jgi:VIT1/CCC1 family predicted Fe2+/Mn2+ transporter
MSGEAPPRAVEAPAPRLGAGTIEEGHKSASADRLDDSVFGVLDGVITAISLSVATALVVRLDHAGVFLTIVAAAVAGTLSMFTGSALGARARADLIRRERKREEWEVDHMPDEERREMEEIYRARGFTPAEVEILVARVTSDKTRWVDAMMRDELGLPVQPQSEPLNRAATIGVFYLLGGVLPALPYLIGSLPIVSDLELSVAVGAVELAAVGFLSSLYSERSTLRGILEIVGIGLGTAAAVVLVTLALQPGL